MLVLAVAGFVIAVVLLLCIFFARPAGPAGPRGPTGAAADELGPTGPPGLSIVGPTGMRGSTGAGATGPTGPTGAMGVPGTAANTGAQGPTGPEGLQGGTGPVGSASNTGAQGPTGGFGPTGPAGPASQVFLIYQTEDLNVGLTAFANTLYAPATGAVLDSNGIVATGAFFVVPVDGIYNFNVGLAIDWPPNSEGFGYALKLVVDGDLAPTWYFATDTWRTIINFGQSYRQYSFTIPLNAGALVQFYYQNEGFDHPDTLTLLARRITMALVSPVTGLPVIPP